MQDESSALLLSAAIKGNVVDGLLTWTKGQIHKTSHLFQSGIYSNCHNANTEDNPVNKEILVHLLDFLPITISY